MAKDKNSKQAAAQTPAKTNEVNEENVVEVRSKGLVGNDDLSKDVLDTIQKEKDDRVKAQMKSRYQNANYSADRALLKLRRRRREDDVARKMLTKRSDLRDALMGFDITEEWLKHHKISGDEGDVKILDKDLHVKKGQHVAPFIDYVDYDDKKDDLDREERKLYEDADTVSRKESKKIQAAYGDYWRPVWDNF